MSTSKKSDFFKLLYTIKFCVIGCITKLRKIEWSLVDTIPKNIVDIEEIKNLVKKCLNISKKK